MAERFGGTGPLKSRPTLDVVVVLFTITVALVLTVEVTTVLILEVLDSATDTESLVSVIDNQIGVILGALLGLIAGQASRPSPPTVG
jgi:predicted MFS family arabinose efflux permease